MIAYHWTLKSVIDNEGYRTTPHIFLIGRWHSIRITGPLSLKDLKKPRVILRFAVPFWLGCLFVNKCGISTHK